MSQWGIVMAYIVYIQNVTVLPGCSRSPMQFTLQQSNSHHICPSPSDQRILLSSYIVQFPSSSAQSGSTFSACSPPRTRQSPLYNPTPRDTPQVSPRQRSHLQRLGGETRTYVHCMLGVREFVGGVGSASVMITCSTEHE